MPASITRALPFTVISSDATSTAPASNANDDRPGKVWRTTAMAGFVIIDLGTGASYDMIGVIGSSMIATDTVRVQTGTTATGTGAFDQTVSAFTGKKPDGFTTKTCVPLGATRSERYVRLDFVSASSVEVQRIVVGPSLVTIGIDYEADHSILDTSEVTGNLGVDTIVKGLRKPKWKFTMSRVPETDWRSTWVGFLAAVGKTEPVLFIPFMETPTAWQADAVFGKIRNDVSGKLPGMLYRVVEMTIEGISL